MATLVTPSYRTQCLREMIAWGHERRRAHAEHYDAILADYVAGYPVSPFTVDAAAMMLDALVEADALASDPNPVADN